MLIESEDESAAREFLNGAKIASKVLGKNLFDIGAVKIVSIKDGVFTCSVSDLKEQIVKLFLKDLNWVGECSCDFGKKCKHCYAAMHALLEYERETPAAAVVKKPVPAKKSAKSKAKEKAAPATFAEIIEERLGRPLHRDEARKTAEIEGIYAKYGDSTRIAEQVLSPVMRGSISRWNYQMYEIWPARPKDAWEAWLYIAAFLQTHKVALPAFLASITTKEEIDALIAERERNTAIEQWRARLQSTANSTDLNPAQAVSLRLILRQQGAQLEWRQNPDAPFEPVKRRQMEQMHNDWNQGQLQLDNESIALWMAYRQGVNFDHFVSYSSAYATAILNPVLRNPMLAASVLTEQGLPFERSPASLQWQIKPAVLDNRDYELRLALPDGSSPPPLLIALPGRPCLYVGADTIFEAPRLDKLSASPSSPNRIPAPALETTEGVALLDRIGVALPQELEKRLEVIKVRVVFRCSLKTHSDVEQLGLEVRADFGLSRPSQIFIYNGWQTTGAKLKNEATIERVDRSAMRSVPAMVEALKANWTTYYGCWVRKVSAKFPQQFLEWLAHLPPEIEVELDPVLASLRSAPLSASINLEVEPTGIDWFDLKIALNVSDTELTQEELALLLDANGQYVRLGAKGWRRLELNLSPEDEAQIADLGLSARDFSSKPQRFHALQLANKATARLLSNEQAAAIQRRAEEIQTRVAPEVPAAIQAELRPYQIAGFHFLAYLSTNRFGGILADDMGLGKTVQTLTWLAWLRSQTDGKQPGPSLVVCPKSVIDNWQNEAARFFPELRVKRWQGGEPEQFKETLKECDLLVVNYAQLRNLEQSLGSVDWHAAILDEAQFIKNPSSQTAQVACALRASHRLALSGTPIENRLLDLWSIMMFTMPGVLGPRAEFAKRFDQRTDPLARRRLSARVRPFVLRRTKSEVASDLPDRIEEDILCELEGVQATLYQAELKSARQQLLKLKTSRDLDKARFNVLTSLLRLRQICCHPSLVNGRTAKEESAKVNTLFDLLEPIMEEGSKVLVFSQFVEMLGIIEEGIQSREWRSFKLTGKTEDRGALVDEFQSCEGAAVFLISLRAGGFGLNLTAASYVVIFDPWWNPAAENQAIDRTHRIGQTNKVIAYRLLVKATIEEKIRALQRQKSAMASDVLGEETFAKALTMEDFQFLLA